MMLSRLHRFFGNQRPHMVAAIRGTAAALTALAAAELLGLACPYWAAMTALIVIQPTRGLLLEKSFYRLLGTVVGSSAGLLFLLYTRSPIVLTIALSLWVAGCVGIGNLLYGFRSYAFLRAGCTCVVIAMSGYQNQPLLYDIAFGRVACIIVGIIFATLVTALFTPRQSRGELMDRLDGVAAESVAWLALLLRQGRENNLSEVLDSWKLSSDRAGIIREMLLSLSSLSQRQGDVAQVLENAANALYEVLDPRFLGESPSGLGMDETRRDEDSLFIGSAPWRVGRRPPCHT